MITLGKSKALPRIPLSERCAGNDMTLAAWRCRDYHGSCLLRGQRKGVALVARASQAQVAEIGRRGAGQLEHGILK